MSNDLGDQLDHARSLSVVPVLGYYDRQWIKRTERPDGTYAFEPYQP